MSLLDKEIFYRELLHHAEKASMALNSEQTRLLEAHCEFMLEWNVRINLTRITDTKDIVVRHILDAILPARRLPDTGTALDVGTGAGFPGVPLKVMHPRLTLTLLDAGRKKVSFLKTLRSRLSLPGLDVVQSTWEQWVKCHEHKAPPYRLITMRAVKLEPVHLERLASALLVPGGLFVWWAGPKSGTSTQHLTLGTPMGKMLFDRTYSYSLPGISQEREIMIWVKKR